MMGINGWKVGSLFGGRGFYSGDWLKRAAAAKGGVYSNDGVEAIYPMTRVDATGDTLDGSKHNYTLTFPAGQLPPVNAFWSVTMYDGTIYLVMRLYWPKTEAPSVLPPGEGTGQLPAIQVAK